MRPARIFGFCRPRLCAVLLLAAGAAGLVAPVRAQSAAERGYRAEAVRAMFMLNFIRFTEWPVAVLPAGEPFVIGVAGSRALEDELLRLAKDTTVHALTIRVVSIKTARDLEACDAVYIGPPPPVGEESAPALEELLPFLRGKPVLVVSESPTFPVQGGILNLYSGEGGRLRFEISTANARASGLALSARLLTLARIVDASAREEAP